MLKCEGVEVLYDDRDCSAGEKLADADLLGAPLRVLVSDKTLAVKKVEVKERSKATVKLITVKELLKKTK